MALDICGQEKPVYIDGQCVNFDIGNGVTKGQGRIRGRASEGLIDLWIIEIIEAEGIDKGLYPWSCFVCPHTLITV